MIAELESDLTEMRTREDEVASARQAAGVEPTGQALLELHDSGNYTQAELAELLGVGRSTIYSILDGMRPAPPEQSGRSRISVEASS